MGRGFRVALSGRVNGCGTSGTGACDRGRPRRREREIAPFVFTGVQILHPRLFSEVPSGAFSLNRVYDLAIEEERLFSVVHDGIWLHVGSPNAIALAEEMLRWGRPNDFVW